MGGSHGALNGKVALVTGASRGIGQAVALALAEAGASLALTSTREGGCADTLAALAGRGIQARAFACDLGALDQVDRLAQEVQAAFPSVDVLVNNAGTVLRAGCVEMTDAQFERVLAVNLTGVFALTRRVLPGMLQRGQGRVVNVSSISGTLGTPRLTAYCASKWGLNGFTQALATELKGTGVCVSAVLPGSVDTQMLEGSGFAPEMSPAEVARVVRFLCTEAPAAMNGSLVEVFG